MLYPPVGNKRVSYQRPSTLGKDLDKGEGLIPWEQTMVAIGLAKERNLFARVQAILAKGGSWGSNKEDFKRIVKTAKKAAGAEDRADRGTALHDLCEAAEIGWLDWDFVPEHLKAAMDAYCTDIVPKLDIAARECFVAIDETIHIPGVAPIELRAAGSIDRIGSLIGGDGKRKIIDIKTGQDDRFRMGVSGQTWLYSRGRLYQDDEFGQDIPWAEWHKSPTDGNPSYRAETNVDLDEAWMLHLSEYRGKSRWTIYRVPLALGGEIVACGQWARKVRSVPEFERVDL